MLRGIHERLGGNYMAVQSCAELGSSSCVVDVVYGSDMRPGGAER